MLMAIGDVLMIFCWLNGNGASIGGKSVGVRYDVCYWPLGGIWVIIATSSRRVRDPRYKGVQKGFVRGKQKGQKTP